MRDWLRGWRLLSWRSAVVAAFVLYILAGFLLAPVLVRKLALDGIQAATGRTATLDSVRVNPLTLSLTIRGFALPDRAGSTLLRFDELHVNAQLSSLFRWTLVLKEVRLASPRVSLRRFQDGRVNVQELIEEISRRAAAEPGAAPEPAAAGPGELFPLVLQHILVTEASVEVDDRARPEPLDLEFGPSRLELHDISTLPGREGEHEFVIGLRDGGKIRISGDAVLEPLGLEGTVALDDLDVEQVWPLLATYFDFDLAAGRVSGGFRYAVSLESDGLHAGARDLQARIRDLDVELRQADTRIAGVAEATVTGGRFSWPEGDFGADAVAVSSADAFLWLEPDGTFGWMELVPEETRVQVATTYREVKETASWKASLGRFEVRSATARFEDRTFDEPLTFALEEAAVVLTDIVTEPGAAWGLEASATLPGGAPATLTGEMGIGPVFATSEVGLTDLDLTLAQPYLARLLPLALRSGRMETSGRVAFRLEGEGPMATFDGDLAIRDVEIGETVTGTRFLGWHAVEAGGVAATQGPLSLAIRDLSLQGVVAEAVMAADGRINLLGLLAAITSSPEQDGAAGADPTATGAAATFADGTGPEAASASPGASAQSGGLPPIEVGSLTLEGVSASYTDGTLDPPLTLAVDDVAGTVTDISSTGKAPSHLELGGAVRSGGRLKVSGDVDLLDPKHLTDIVLDIREADLPPVSPLGVRYLGHDFEQGHADIGLDYQIANSDLEGRNRLVTQGLALGPKVEGEGMLDLPVKLGVSLLTDRQGRVTLEFPVAGNLDDPEFGLGGAIGGAVKSVMGQLVRSPFRLLARLGGGKDDEDYAAVEFEAGAADLEPAEAEKLATLAAGFQQRPGLIVQVRGVWDPRADGPALQEQALEQRVAERLAAREETADSTGVPARLQVLEAMAREELGPERLETIRQKHTKTAEAEGAEPSLDVAGYERELAAALAAARPVGDEDLRQLGGERARAVQAALVAGGGVPAARVQVGEARAIKSSGSRWVRLELEVAAGD